MLEKLDISEGYGLLDFLSEKEKDAILLELINKKASGDKYAITLLQERMNIMMLWNMGYGFLQEKEEVIMMQA